MRETMATVLIVTAIIALATTTLIQGQEQATAQSAILAAPASSRTTLPPLSVPLDSGEVGPFAFGYLVFENDPANGVPGFGPLPPRTSAQ